MTGLPKALGMVGWVIFGIATVAINYEVKYAMHHQGTGSVQTLGSLKVGQPAPDFTLQDLSGRPTTLSSYRGQKVVLIDFWALWCGPCRMAMPSVQDMAEKYKNHGFEVLSVNQGDPTDQVRAFIERKKYTFHVVLDTGQAVGNSYGVTAIPTVVIVDKKGVVRWLSVGYSENDDALASMVDKLTKE